MDEQDRLRAELGRADVALSHAQSRLARQGIGALDSDITAKIEEVCGLLYGIADIVACGDGAAAAPAADLVTRLDRAAPAAS